MKRGRPAETPAVKKAKWELKCKSHTGDEITYVYNEKKNPNGVSTIVNQKGKAHIPSIDKKESYTPQPVVMVFKLNRKNAKPKMKIWNNTNIDYINSCEKLAGVPNDADIMELSVGTKFINEYKSKYNLK
jgi:hypothetical protein